MKELRHLCQNLSDMIAAPLKGGYEQRLPGDAEVLAVRGRLLRTLLERVKGILDGYGDLDYICFFMDPRQWQPGVDFGEVNVRRSYATYKTILESIVPLFNVDVLVRE